MKKILFTLLIMLAVVKVFPQQESDSIAGPSKADPEVVVGAIGGTVDVSALGGAVYTIPIQVPEGIAGMQPNLSIVYNSQSGNGLLGWGWNLGGLSAITRCGADLYHDGFKKGVDFSNSVLISNSFDRFSLDGQRLMLTKGNYYGENGSEYKTEIDGMSKIIAHTDNGIVNGPGWFEVYTADGTIIEYGKEGARMAYDSDNGGKEVALWLINRIVDRNGNYILYSYEIGGAHYALKKIEYVRNDDLNLPYWNYVEFGYENRKDKEISFIGNHTLKQIYLLKSVSIKDQNGQELWKYAFGYKVPQPYEAKKYTYKKLENINFTCGNEKYNPTIITWGVGYGYSCDNYYIDGQNVQNSFTYGFRFSGDFDGNGRTDFIGTDGKQAGKLIVYRSDGNGYFSTATTLPKDSNLDWVYVADLNDDGLDDVICSSRERTSNPFKREKVFLDFFIAKVDDDGNISFDSPRPSRLEYKIRRRHQETLLIGDFLGDGRTCVISQACKIDGRETDGCDTINEEKDWGLFSYLISLDDNNHLHEEDISGLIPQSHSFLAADFNADGITEIYCCDKDDNSTKIIRLNYTIFGIGSQAISGSLLSVYHTLFPGDFNGDGKIDLLTFADDGNGGGSWQINFFKEDDLYWPQIDITSKMPFLNPGNQGLSMRGRINGNYKFVRVSDFDGDGKSDIAVIKDAGMPMDSLVIFYGPLVENDAGNMEFSQRRSYNVVANAAPYYACIGNFFGEENVAFINRYRIFHATPMTDRYNVESITDGMNNSVSFEYDYLIARRRPSANDFYVRSHRCESGANHIRPCSLPIKALKKQTSSNGNMLNTTAGFQYENVMLHTKGKGLLGFASATISNRNNGRYVGKVVKESDVSSMGEHCMLLPAKETAYGPSNAKISESVSQYTKLKCLADMKGKVVIPVIKRQITDSYDLSDNELFLKRSIVENEYDQMDYLDVVKVMAASSGVSARDVNSVDECEFRNSTEMKYYDDNIASWVINRPKSKLETCSVLGSDESVKSLTVYSYNARNPFLPKYVTVYPSGIESDADLATTTKYEYNEVGQLTAESLYEEGRSEHGFKTMYGYSDDFRFLEKQTVEFDPTHTMDYETTYTYDPLYGYMTSETDANSLTTQFGQDPLGLLSKQVNPDQTSAIAETRWVVFGDSYAPGNATYYSIATQYGVDGTQLGETRTYYDAKGRVRRSMTYGLEQAVIFVDTEYDSEGRISRVSDPYFQWTAEDDILWTYYKYDIYGRTTKTTLPDRTSQEVQYNGLTVSTTANPAPGSILPVQTTSQTVNVMGWTKQSVDANGTPVNYSYYPDGALEYTQIGDDENTRVSMEYDKARNRTLLNDPDYGETTSLYNAFGQLIHTQNPKNTLTDYEYDNLGRMKTKTEKAEDGEVHVTEWTYSNENGEKGLLKSVSYDNGFQAIGYGYDELNRLQSIKETFDNVTYGTSYTYEDNTGRLSTTSYPTCYLTKNVYSQNGHLVKVCDEKGNALWQLHEKNAYGQILACEMGSGIYGCSYEYDDMTHTLKSQTLKDSENILQSFSYHYDDFRNLDARNDNVHGMKETFQYDQLNRLVNITLDGNQTGVIKYDSYGRMRMKEADGRMVFDAAAENCYLPEKPHALREAVMNVNPFNAAQQDVTYTMFDKVKTIRQDRHTAEFTYGFDQQRIRMEIQTAQGPEVTKTYVGNCEYIDEQSSSSHIERTYLSGPMGVFAVYQTSRPLNGKDDLPHEDIYYINKDHLGSWTAILDDEGEALQQFSYDAWGNSRDPYTWRGTTTTRCMFDRGFTGHEMLYDFGLINMNGRMYDPVMSSFLSPDNYVQSPDYSQSFNRYSYCWNNPLKYTDPSGELIGIDDIIIGAAVGIMFNTTMQFVRGNINSAADMHTAMFVGALSGAAGAWAGGAAAGTFGTFGAAGGGLTGASGSAAGGFVGNACDAWCHGATFGQGFTAGLIGAGMGIAIGGTIGALSGGFSAKWHGGDFWTGVGAHFDFSVINESDPFSSNYDSKYYNLNKDKYENALTTGAEEKLDFRVGDVNVDRLSCRMESTNPEVQKRLDDYSINNRGYYEKHSGGEVYGTTVKSSVFKHSEVFVSPRVVDGYLFSYDVTLFEAVVGHEFNHAYHIYRGLPISQTGPSEWAARDYTKAVYNAVNDSRAKGVIVPEYDPRWKVPVNYKFSRYRYP